MKLVNKQIVKHVLISRRFAYSSLDVPIAPNNILGCAAPDLDPKDKAIDPKDKA